jgi:ComEC/Rec2-related protein
MIHLSKSPLLHVAITFVLGIMLSPVVASPGFTGLVIIALATLGLFLLTRKRISVWLQRASHILFFGAFGVAGWVLGEASTVVPANDPSFFIGQEMEVEGTVMDDVRTTATGHKTILEITHPMEGKVVLYLPADAQAPQPNDKVRGMARFQAHSTRNPGYADWLHHQGIHATAKASVMTKVGEATGLMSSLKSLRGRMADRFKAVFPNPDLAGLANAMLLGDRSGLDSEVRKDFSATGLSHIVAISGMNFALIYAVLNVLFHPLLGFRRGRQIRSMIVVPLLVFFALLTGANPAVLRAAFMLSLLDLGQSFQRKHHSLNALAASALLFLALDPQCLFMPDFQLSYAAVAGILLMQVPIQRYLMHKAPGIPKFLASGLAVTLAAQAATAPLVVWHFQSFPTYFLLANLLVLPLVTLVVQFGFAGFLLAWIPGVDVAWGGMMEFMLWVLTSMADLLAQLPGATVTALEAGQVGIWMILGQFLIGLVVLERRFLVRASRYVFGSVKGKGFAVAVAGLQRRFASVGLLVVWVFFGFLF